MPANFYFSVNNPNVCCIPHVSQSEVITSHISEDKELQKWGLFAYFVILLTRFAQLESYVIPRESQSDNNKIS